MQKHHKWLHGEIEAWRSQGLIEPPQAEALMARYPVSGAERAWSRIIFSAIGAILAGLGVILFFAYNWAFLPKALKLAMVFAAVIASHGAALWLARGAAPRRGLVEGLHILGTMLFGAGIWLVAQVYHIDEHYPNGILIWSLGALALAWSLPSLAQGFLAVLLVSLWAGVEAFEFRWTADWAPFLVGLGVVPLAWLQRSRVLLFFGLAALLAMLVLTTIALEDELFITVVFFSAILYIAAGLLVPASAFGASAPVFKTLGFTVYLGALYLLSFPWAVEILDDLTFSSTLVTVYFAVPLVAAAAAWLGVLAAGLGRLDEVWRWHWGILSIPLVLVAVLSLEPLPLGGWLAAIPFNLIFLAHCVVFIVQGSRDANPKLVSIACVLFALLVITRYVDLFNSLLLRSLIFLLLGAGLFLVGNFYARTKGRSEEAAP
jgi:uncharacterized membrane protein